MNISPEEKLMYKVMEAVYLSGIPISFKGSMVLKACLAEAGYKEDVRHTVDIDGNWYSESMPTSNQIVEALQNALDKQGIELDVVVYRMYGERRSAGFELLDRKTWETLFTMDIDVNRAYTIKKLYEIDNVRFRGAAPVQITADKLYVVSSDLVFRRIKDVVDLYYISSVFHFEREEIIQVLENSERILGDFDGFINRKDELRHSYEKFRFSGNVNKPKFNEIYESVKQLVESYIPKYGM